MIVSTIASNAIATVTAAIHGHIEPGFEPVKETFQALWDDVEVGASLHISIDNRTVVDLWGGHLDEQQSRPWQSDSLACIYSSTKGVVSLAIACLVEDGLLSYEDQVADHWPAFGAEGKFAIKVAELLSHRAGLYRFEPALTVDELRDWQKCVFQLASQASAPLGNDPFCYHAISWGYLAGELIRQITGQSTGSYLRDRLTGAIGADCFIGLTPEEQKRCADIIGPNRARRAMPSKQTDENRRTIVSNDPVITPYRHISSTAWRTAEVPSTNGHASARGLARCYQAAIDGTLFSESTLEKAITTVAEGLDPALGQELRRAMGFIINSPGCWYGPGERAFGHSGTGGSMGFADPDTGIAFAYVMNQLHVSGPFRSRQLINSLYSCL